MFKKKKFLYSSVIFMYCVISIRIYVSVFYKPSIRTLIKACEASNMHMYYGKLSNKMQEPLLLPDRQTNSPG